MHRIEAVRALAALVTENDLFVCAHGGLRNDWWNSRPGGVDNTCFLTGMDTVSATAFGLSVALPHRRVVALETDGSMLMSAGVVWSRRRPKERGAAQNGSRGAWPPACVRGTGGVSGDGASQSRRGWRRRIP